MTPLFLYVRTRRTCIRLNKACGRAPRSHQTAALPYPNTPASSTPHANPSLPLLWFRFQVYPPTSRPSLQAAVPHPHCSVPKQLYTRRVLKHTQVWISGAKVQGGGQSCVDMMVRPRDSSRQTACLLHFPKNMCRLSA